MRIPPLLSDWLVLRKPNSHGIDNSLSPWIWNWHGQSLLTCCDEMESSAHTEQSYTRMRLSLKPGLKMTFSGSKLAPRKVVHLLGSWDTARRAAHGQQWVSRIQCGASGNLFSTYRAPVEGGRRDRCFVGKLNIKADVLFGPHWGHFSQGSAVFQLGMPHSRLSVDRHCTSLTSSVCHGFQ